MSPLLSSLLKVSIQQTGRSGRRGYRQDVESSRLERRTRNMYRLGVVWSYAGCTNDRLLVGWLVGWLVGGGQVLFSADKCTRRWSKF